MKRGFAPAGHLALAPQAFGGMYEARSAPAPMMVDGVAIIEISGPIVHHPEWCFDSYDGIKARVAEALAARPKTVVLRLDSPGGMVSGCFETSRSLRAMANAAGVPLLAYVDGSALSAAYALACAAERICVPATGLVGSIGTIEALVDATKQAEMYGLSFKLIASGTRKTDGHPHVPATDEAIAGVQARVDSLAEIFFELVAESRGVNVDAIRALEAGILHGAQAVAAGLADEITTFDELLASIASGSPAPAGQANEDTMDEDELRAALQAIIDDEEKDEKAKARARRALAAMAEDDDGEEPEGGAEGGGDDAGDDDDDAKAIAARALAGVTRLEAAQAAQALAAEDAERAALLATRPDLDEATRELLAAAPLEQVKAFVAKAPRRALRPAATAVVGGTPAVGQGGLEGQPTNQKKALAIRMGLATAERAPKLEGNRQTFPILSRAERAKYVEARAKAQTAS